MKYNRFVAVLFLLLAASSFPAYAEQFPVVVEAKVRAEISAEREGVLFKLNVDVGNSVKKNALLASVFNRELVLRKEQLEATRKYLDVQVENKTKLNEKGMV